MKTKIREAYKKKASAFINSSDVDCLKDWAREEKKKRAFI